MAEKSALRDLAEACAYLRDPLLRARYEEITAAVRDQLARGLALEVLMGSRIDALKLVSSLTLFRAAAEILNRERSCVGAVKSESRPLDGQFSSGNRRITSVSPFRPKAV